VGKQRVKTWKSCHELQLVDCAQEAFVESTQGFQPGAYSGSGSELLVRFVCQVLRQLGMVLVIHERYSLGGADRLDGVDGSG
jgi:hypothetical protein